MYSQFIPTVVIGPWNFRLSRQVQARLLLASLYAGTDTTVPDPRLGVTWTTFKKIVATIK